MQNKLNDLVSRGRLDEAEALCRSLLKSSQNKAPYLYWMGMIFWRKGDLTQAEAQFRQILSLQPNEPNARGNLAQLLLLQGNARQSERELRKLVKAHPKMAKGYCDLGMAVAAQDRHKEALILFDKCLKVEPGMPAALLEQGRSYRALQQYAKAEKAFRGVISAVPAAQEGWNALGALFMQQNKYKQAVETYRKGLTHLPNNAALHSNLAGALFQLSQFDVELDRNTLLAQAIAEAQEAIRLDPKLFEAYDNLGQLSALTNRLDEAQACYEKCLENTSVGEKTLLRYLAFLAENKKYADALKLEQRLTAEHESIGAMGPHVIRFHSELCYWRDYERLLEEARQYVLRADCDGVPALSPFACLGLGGLSPNDLLRYGKLYSERRFAGLRARFKHAARDSGRRLRVGYLSADFRRHPMGYLMRPIFAAHRRDQVEVFAYSIKASRDSEQRDLIKQAVEHWVDLDEMSAQDAAARIHRDGIDILVDLNGYTTHCRPEILALRPAPLQVGYLGFTGTTGASFLDYYVADEYVVPREWSHTFSEKLAYLPDHYFPYDTGRKEGRAIDRKESGLPEDAFVLCSFNNSYKFTPERFDTWCSILNKSDEAVLWLPQFSEMVADNLRSEAEKRGVDAGRLVFADRVDDIEDHLKRVGLADLFLDTNPYNAHTTAMDALWAGVPIVTLPGSTMASRVAGSLLSSGGLDGLIVKDELEYQQRVLELIADRSKLDVYRERLRDAKSSGGLFDVEKLAVNLERLYQAMWRRHETGCAPETISLD